MEITAALGIALTFACIVISILIPGAGIMNYMTPSALFIVLGGVACSAAASYPADTLKNAARAVKVAFRAKKTDLAGDMEMALEAADIARRRGILALEEKAAEMEDPFLKRGVTLIIDGSDPEFVRDIMDTELTLIRERHQQTQALFLQLASFSTAFGMIGILIGLIAMLSRLDDMASLGSHMAAAMTSALYGAILANAVFTPVAKRLKSVSDGECMRREMMLEGILSIQNGENPRIIRERLSAFLPCSQFEPATPPGRFALEKYFSVFTRQKKPQ